MTNQQIARVFEEIAALLQIKGENPFKVRAYENAVEVINALTESLAEIRRREDLDQIPGIGKSIAQKIVELLDTGGLKYHADLLGEFPPTLLELLQISEVGPRTVQRLHREMGIASIEALEKAAQEGKLRELKGFGAKTEQNILRAIERLRARREARLPLAVAHPVAMRIVEEMRSRAPVDQITPAGSLRRMKETIGDIDILVTSSEIPAVMEAFATLPQAAQVLAKGPTKTSILTDAGLQVDLRALPPESFGAALQYFTGSKAHNIKLRERGQRRGLKMSEYGIFETKGNTRIGGATEEEMYAPFGIQPMPPEMREDTGEIEAALKGTLPVVVSVEDIKGDLHVHSKYSDGRRSIEEMVRAGKARGYKYVGIGDHSKGRGIANGLDEKRLAQQIKEVRALDDRVKGIRILIGSEVDIRRDGTLDFEEETLAQLDFCVASVHSAFHLNSDLQTERIIKAMQNPYMDILGHPTGRIIGQRDPYDLDMERVIQAAAELGVALEINSFPDRLDLKDVHARRAIEVGATIAINTDSHDLEHLALIQYGVATARRAWVEAKHVLNARPLREMLATLRRNHAGGRAKGRRRAG